MPQLQANVEVGAFSSVIAKALDRPSVYALKFLVRVLATVIAAYILLTVEGPEVAASTNIKNERYILNGAHD